MDTAVTSLQEPRWATVVRGVLLLLFGLIALGWPGLTIVTLAWLFGLYLLVAGIIDIFGGILGIGRGGFSWLKLFIGLAELGVGVYIMQHTTLALHLLILLVGFTLLIRGLLEIVFSFNRDVPSDSKGMLAVVGVLSIIVGFIILRYPAASGIAWVWVLGIYALVAGTVTIALGLSHKN